MNYTAKNKPKAESLVNTPLSVLFRDEVDHGDNSGYWEIEVKFSFLPHPINSDHDASSRIFKMDTLDQPSFVVVIMEPITNFLNIFASEENSINYLVECGPFVKALEMYQKTMKIPSPISGSILFKNCKLPYNDVLMLSYFWLSCANNKKIEMYTGHCKSTVTHYKRFLRQGENIIVEIDETKMGNNKHPRGHSVNRPWVLGKEIPDRTEATLLGIIRTHVLPGSIIMTDCFRSYHNLSQFYTHLTDPETGALTNCIEGTWDALKYQIPPQNRTNSLNDDGQMVENVLNDNLGEFELRRKHSYDLWAGFLSAQREVIYTD
ncbi:hypothetical protein RF11_12924 [Thelohanellus kitauei]|uniref:ISXO2-like transposase domain-containing protein n=1 Tax=Thelohanellus kitauei TaxID=669202 RepID=A0A0C2I8G0_THEKT|nr:hypothetical protein RF11_12924 [Thelohanellus kitauei]